MTRKLFFSFLWLMSVFTVSCCVPVYGGIITFSGPTTSNSINDIITGGTLVQAINFNGTTRTVDPGGLNITFVGSGIDPFIGSPGTSNHGSEGDASFYTLSSDNFDFTRILRSSFSWQHSPPGILSAGTITLAGLTSGTAYEVQLWAADTRAGAQDLSQGIGDGANGDDPDLSWDYRDASGATYVTGNFTASGTTQAITFTGLFSPSVGPDFDQIRVSALILRSSTAAVPEPSSFAVLTVGVLGAIRYRRPKPKQVA